MLNLCLDFITAESKPDNSPSLKKIKEVKKIQNQNKISKQQNQSPIIFLYAVKFNHSVTHFQERKL